MWTSGVLGLSIILAFGCSSVPEDNPGGTAVLALNSVPVLLGDANQDGVVSITDAQLADAFSRGQNVPGLSPVAADANCDSIVDSEDVMLISEAFRWPAHASLPRNRETPTATVWSPMPWMRWSCHSTWPGSHRTIGLSKGRF